MTRGKGVSEGRVRHRTRWARHGDTRHQLLWPRKGRWLAVCGLNLGKDPDIVPGNSEHFACETCCQGYRPTSRGSHRVGGGTE